MPPRQITVHALRLEVNDVDGSPLPSMRPFWELLAQHPERLRPVHTTTPEKSVSGEVTVTPDGATGSVSGTALRNLGEAAELTTYIRERLPLRENQGIARTLHWRAWNLEQYRNGPRRLRGALVLFPSVSGAARHTGFEKLLRSAVHDQGWFVDISAIREADPLSRLELQDGVRSIKLAGIITTDQQGLTRAGGLTIDLGITHARAELKLQPTERGRFPMSLVNTVFQRFSDNRDGWEKLVVEGENGLPLDLFDGLVRYRLNVDVHDAVSGVLPVTETLRGLNELYRDNRDTLLRTFGLAA